MHRPNRGQGSVNPGESAELAVVMHHLSELRRKLAAIGAAVIEILDDRDIAVHVARRRNLLIAQHLCFS